MEYLEEEQQSQQPLERNLNAHKSMRDYRNPPWMSMPLCMVPPTTAPYGNSYKRSWRNHLNFSWGQESLHYAPPAPPQYASSSQPQSPQSISPTEQAILDLTKLVGDFVEEQKTFNAQLSRRIDTVESSLNQKLDVLQIDLEKRIDIIQQSISKLTYQHSHQEEECLSDTMVEEQCQQQLLLESSDIGDVVYPWEKKEADPMLLTKEAVEEHQENNLPLAPTDSVHILPSPASQSQPKTPAAETKVIPPLLPILQNFRKLVATAQIFATTSKKLAIAHTAWHSGWFRCWFRHGAPRPRHFCKLQQFQQPPKA